MDMRLLIHAGMGLRLYQPLVGVVNIIRLQTASKNKQVTLHIDTEESTQKR